MLTHVDHINLPYLFDETYIVEIRYYLNT